MQYIKDIEGDIEFLYTNRVDGGTELYVDEIGHGYLTVERCSVNKAKSYQLHYIISGFLVFNGEELRQGQGFFVRQGEVYTEQSYDGGFVQYWINFTGSNVIELLNNTGIGTETCTYKYAGGGNEVKLIENSFTEVFELARELTQSQYYTKGLLYKLLSVHECVNAPLGNTNEYVKKVCEYINTHYAEEIKIDELVKEQGLSPKYFCRLFRRDIGMTMINYLINTRLEAASRLLTHTHKSIKQISYEVGYSNSLYFSTVFRSKYGVPPSEWRNSEKI